MLSQRTATATELAAGKPSGPGGHSTKPLSAEAFPQLNLHQCKPKSGCENARARAASVCYHHLHEGSLGPRPSTRSCMAQTCAYTTAAPTGFLMQLSQIWWEQTGTAPPALRSCHWRTPEGQSSPPRPRNGLHGLEEKLPSTQVTVTLFKSTTFASYL